VSGCDSIQGRRIEREREVGGSTLVSKPLALLAGVACVALIVFALPPAFDAFSSVFTPPPPPAPSTIYRPASVGVVAGYNLGIVQLEDGSTLTLPSMIPRVGYAGGGIGKGWLVLFGPGYEWREAMAPSGEQSWMVNSHDYAWDRDGDVLFADGLELPRAPRFQSFDQPVERGGDRVWQPHDGWAMFHVTVQGQVVDRILSGPN
jgi:hypothetical protein